MQRAGYTFPVYSIAKTVADCFKFSSIVAFPSSTALLQRVIKEQACSPAEVAHYAKVCRVSQLLRPYIETLEQTALDSRSPISS